MRIKARAEFVVCMERSISASDLDAGRSVAESEMIALIRRIYGVTVVRLSMIDVSTSQ